MIRLQGNLKLVIPRALTIAAFVAVMAAMTLVAAQMAQAQTYTVLHEFTGGVDGAFPHQMIQGADGNFYGTSTFGGANNFGNIYKLDPSDSLTVLYSFEGGAGGVEPEGTVFRDSNGDLYGTTREGGDPHCKCGIFFELDTNDDFTILHTFTGADGAFASNNIVSVNGDLYGTTESGGSNGWGVIYKITKTGHYTVVHNFPSDNYLNTQSDLTRDSTGNIYGETFASIFKLDTAGNFSTIYTFTDGVNDGAGPVGHLILNASGMITGTALRSPDSSDCGEVFRLESDGTAKALHHFSGWANGCSPETGLIDVGSVLYGTTAYGGDLNCTLFAREEQGCGLLYQIDKTGKYTAIHAFDGTDGAWPQDELTKGSDGSVYGITKIGGSGRLCTNVADVLGCGVIFKYTP
jgi:uncharacterized repeat protein (TIGR03803 family)